ncbi:MAG TPA: hypothetical protein VN922_16335 [Bacteroidia bacterium]|nr:hypothetical protein [Bacteroidia bacterium]
MRKLTILATVLLFSALSWGQKIQVHEQMEDIGGGKNNALVVTIYGADEGDVEKAWKSMMKDYGAKVSSEKGGIMKGSNAIIKEMGDKPIDLYARFDTKKEEIELVVAFDLGGAYLSSSAHADKYKVAEKIMHDFGVKMTAEAITEKQKTQQKALDKLTSQEKDLEKENKNLNSDIDDYQNKIKKAQDAIVKNKDEQAKKQTEISNQQKVVEELDKKAKEVK